MAGEYFDFGNTPITQDITLKAKWCCGEPAPTTFTVTFDLSQLPPQYGTRIATPAPQQVEPQGFATDPNIDWCLSPENVHYGIFTGWYELNGADPTQNWDFTMMPVSRNMTLTAKFDDPTSTIICGALPEPD